MATNLYSIVQPVTSVEMGPIEASSPGEALDALARMAGYRDHAHACEVTDDDDDLIVTEIEAYHDECDLYMDADDEAQNFEPWNNCLPATDGEWRTRE